MNTTRASSNTVYEPANSDTEALRPIEVFVKRDFLTKRELRGLTKYVFAHEADFTPSTVIPDGVPDGATDPSYRKSRVLYELGEYVTLFQDRLLAILPEVLRVFNREAFPIAHIDTQITASNDGDFFKVHRDNSFTEPLDVSLRELSYVHYFHSEPKAFSGGQLRIYDSEDGEVQSSEDRILKTIVPRQNTLVVFSSSYDHEVLPVRCPTGKFVNSRFTVNGWLIKEAITDDGEATTDDEASPPDMEWLADAVRSLNVARPYQFQKVYLTLEEASEFSGLSFEYLERLIQDQTVKAVDDGGWKIRRRDLESL
ncbi:MAG: 2OG-Fe(II) oxygenase [Pyrinomonadaceae bacterium]|nr:2OG-Fe(II) oxygenase [Pyrinomonadaceae bacterium]